MQSLSEEYDDGSIAFLNILEDNHLYAGYALEMFVKFLNRH
jgi:hypothetical protein